MTSIYFDLIITDSLKELNATVATNTSGTTVIKAGGVSSWGSTPFGLGDIGTLGKRLEFLFAQDSLNLILVGTNVKELKGLFPKDKKYTVDEVCVILEGLAFLLNNPRARSKFGRNIDYLGPATFTHLGDILLAMKEIKFNSILELFETLKKGDLFDSIDILNAKIMRIGGEKVQGLVGFDSTGHFVIAHTLNVRAVARLIYEVLGPNPNNIPDIIKTTLNAINNFTFETIHQHAKNFYETYKQEEVHENPSRNMFKDFIQTYAFYDKAKKLALFDNNSLRSEMINFLKTKEGKEAFKKIANLGSDEIIVDVMHKSHIHSLIAFSAFIFPFGALALPSATQVNYEKLAELLLKEGLLEKYEFKLEPFKKEVSTASYYKQSAAFSNSTETLYIYRLTWHAAERLGI